MCIDFMSDFHFVTACDQMCPHLCPSATILATSMSAISSNLKKFSTRPNKTSSLRVFAGRNFPVHQKRQRKREVPEPFR